LRTFYILFIIVILTFSCGKDSKNPVDSGGDDNPVANCGPDLTLKVGELAVVDVSASLPKDKSKILYYDWDGDINNPKTGAIEYGVNGLSTKHYLGFITQGTYKLYLKVATEKGESEPDTMTITVLPRTNNLIEDPILELAIRYSKKYATGVINEMFLNEIESITTIQSVINSLKGIEHCKNLKTLNLSYKDNEDITPLLALINLESLKLTDNKSLKDISPLKNLVNLKYLDLSGCTSISSVEPLSGLTALTYLNLDSDENMSGYHVLSKLVNLEKLYIYKMASDENGDISFLSQMINLNILSIRYSGITDITPLKNLKGLKELNLYSNNISDIRDLKNCIILEKLNVAGNRIKEIEIVRTFKNLISLDISGNSVEDITPLNMLEHIRYFVLQDNKIYNIKPLADNENLGTNNYINLVGNPLDSISVNVYIPNLRARGIEIHYP
jgi:Leucine-rich repeat (LRR) protein